MLSFKTSFSVELLLLKNLSVILFVMELLEKTVSQNVGKAVTPKTVMVLDISLSLPPQRMYYM
jgi:hypothetical protein